MIMEEITGSTGTDVQAVADAESSTIVDRQWEAYVRARDNGHLDFVRDAKLFDNYYVGDQWEDSVKATLDAERRPYHTMNLVLSTINTVSGEYISTRQDIEYRPRNGQASVDTASAITKIVKQVSDDSHSRWVEKQVFNDAVITDRGFFDIRLDYTENDTGEIREISLDPADVLIDPGAREYDPRTWNEVFHTRWLTVDQIEALYGQDNADKVRSISSTTSTFGSDSVEFDPATYSGKQDFYTGANQSYNQQSGENYRLRRIRVIERQYYKFAMRKYFIDKQTGDVAPVPDSWSSDKIQSVANVYQLAITTRGERRVRWTVTCDKHLFSDDWSPYRRFTVIPFFCYFRRGKPFGVVRNLISPQDMLNKGISQELHVVNTTANSGWMIETGSLVNMTSQELAQIGAKTGLVLEFQRNSTPPQKIQSNQIPTGLDRLSTKATMYFREISGVSDAMLGQPGREISGEALQTKNQRGLIQMDPIFDNLSYTRQLRAEMFLELIQDFYTEERVFRILTAGQEGEETYEEVALNAQTAAGTIVNDVLLGEYSAVVSSRPTRDVEDDTQLQLMLQMREVGVMIPDWAIIERSPLEGRKQIASWVRNLQGAAEPTEQEVYMAQMAQELELRRMMAEVGELEARTQERAANAAKLMAEAEAVGEGERMKIVALGAELRKSLESDLLALQAKREEMQTRLQIMDKKNDVTKYAAMLQTLTKRLDTEAKERVETAKVQAQITAARGYGTSFNGGKK